MKSLKSFKKNPPEIPLGITDERYNLALEAIRAIGNSGGSNTVECLLNIRENTVKAKRKLESFETKNYQK